MINQELMDRIINLVLSETSYIDNKSKMKINISLNTHFSHENGVVLKDYSDMIKKSFRKIKWYKRRKNVNMDFDLYYSNVSEENKIMLKENLYIPNGVNFDYIERIYNISEDLTFFILVLLHEIAHVFYMVEDMAYHGYLKNTHKDVLEYNLFLESIKNTEDKKEVNINYRKLHREKIADDFSIIYFKRNIDEISTLVRLFA